jgi:hypothetical protein
MKISIAFVLVFLVGAAIAQPKDTRYFELRIYYAANGKLDALVKRFTDHTTRIFEKHGMQNIGYWVPVTNDKNTLYYILAYPSADARDKSWKEFGADPEWTKAKSESEVNGKLVDSVKSVFLNPTDIMPAINGASTGAERIFELRTYHCQPGKLPNLITRFKDHTVKIFENNGMTNIFYFVTAEKDSKQPDLVYLLAHKSIDAAKKSWQSFLVDPDWIKARDESEKDGKILIGLESVYLKPLPISKLK